MKRLWLSFLFAFCFSAFAAEVIPPAPAQYFNDYAHVVSADTVARLDRTLEDFERQNSSQIVVAVFPTMQSDSSIEDYTVRVAREWKVGQKDKNNGAVLFVFVQDHKMFLQVGYGLEGVLPDALCKRIIAEQIAPRFKAGDFDGGLAAGVQSILAATKGEYQGNGRTVAERRINVDTVLGVLLPLLPFIILFLAIVIGLSQSGRRRSGWTFTSGGFSSGSWSGGGGGFSGGGGGGGFSGGGGSFGGGGAGGSW